MTQNELEKRSLHYKEQRGGVYRDDNQQNKQQVRNWSETMVTNNERDLRENENKQNMTVTHWRYFHAGFSMATLVINKLPI